MSRVDRRACREASAGRLTEIDGAVAHITIGISCRVKRAGKDNLITVFEWGSIAVVHR